MLYLVFKDDLWEKPSPKNILGPYQLCLTNNGRRRQAEQKRSLKDYLLQAI